MGIVAALALVVLAEIVFKLGNDYRESKVQFSGDDLVEFYLPLGYRSMANHEAHARKVVDGDVVFDTIYTIDTHHRRHTPARPDTARTIVFLGDSFVFGEGVANEATLPWRVAESIPDAQVWNLGFSGYGPQQALALVQDETFGDIAQASDLSVIYVFIPGHVRRALGAMRMWLAWGRHFPCYDVIDGQLRLQGSFVQARPWRSRCYDVLGKSQTLRFFHVDWPLRVNDDGLELTARILAATRDALATRAPSATFTVLLFPDMPNNEFHPSRIIPHLDRHDLRYIDLADAVDMNAGGMILLGDGHPSARGYAKVTEVLVPHLTQP